jgi:HTH-type transcriptional regulator / antitoxin HigA
MKAKVIKTEGDYEAALARIEQIIDAKPGTPEAEELELLSTLVDVYEEKTYHIDAPDPLTAIQFRMEQEGLKPKDLVQYLGSASKVSEVLSGQRGLSVAMMRNLVDGLGIPADVFLAKPKVTPTHTLNIENLPWPEMCKRGWLPFKGPLTQAKRRAPELLVAFTSRVDVNRLSPARLKQRVRSGSEMNLYALIAWQIRVQNLAFEQELRQPYKNGLVSLEFVREIAKLSYFEEGPKLAKEFLNKSGIYFVTERHLPHTFLDGAAMTLPNGAPLVALTLRFDRLDNFWFTLAHELAHVALHLDKGENEPFFDDLTSEHRDPAEKDADEFACEALIPKKVWNKAGLKTKCSPSRVRALAEELRINPAIPAGRIRFEMNDYRICNDLVGIGEVRPWFEQTKNQKRTS